jgi:hypothetical protein
MFRFTSRFAQVARPSIIRQAPLRFYGSGPSPLSVQQIEDRILELLRNYDKVPQDKVMGPNEVIARCPLCQ